MSTSGSVNFTINRNDIIRLALEEVGAVNPEESLNAADVSSCSTRLNLMLKAWMAQGVHLWALKEATLFMEVGTASYSLGATGTHCTNTYVHTTLSTDEATSSTSLGITSYTGMSASDNIGIVLDDGTIHWTTISGAPGLTTTIATGLASAASSGNVVFAYTSKINRPQRILSAYRRSIDNTDTPLQIISREEYASLSSKLVQGTPVQLFYDPQLTNGVLYVWSAPSLATSVIRFWYERVLEDFDASTDNPDFPIEWGEALYYGLADRIAKTYGLSLPERAALKAEAAAKLEAAIGYDSEDVPTFFQFDSR